MDCLYMNFRDLTKTAAQVAEEAAYDTMIDYNEGGVTDEDDITPYLLGRISQAFNGNIIAGLHWKSSVLRHRGGTAAEEKRIGADMLIHVTLNTSTVSYAKGVLVQAKRVEPRATMTSSEHADLVSQCNKMLQFSPASFVFDYAKGSMRCGSALKIRGTTSRELYNTCDWTSYRFFLELFRCFVGDSSIKTALVKDLVPVVLQIVGSSDRVDG